MLSRLNKVYSDAKVSLESYRRKKAYTSVQRILKEKGIALNDVSDEDIEHLVAAKIEDWKNERKGMEKSTILLIAIFLLTGL